MEYTLPNGQQIELCRIVSVSPVRDLGPDPRSIDRSRIGFTVHLRKREIVQIEDTYHYTDWIEAKKRLEDERKRIVKAMEERNTAS